MGGEITWTCTPQGNFRFVLKVYRECAGVNFGNTVTLQTNAPGIGNISMSRISITDISPVCSCPGGLTITCVGTPFGSAHMNSGAVEEHIYTSDGSYPNGVPLTGVPPSTGWHFSYRSCCRNNSANIPGQPAWWIRAMMYPYQNTPVNTCFDNSPLPGPIHNPNNVAATIDPHTGEISFTSYTNGAFVTVTKVTAYKNGIKVAEIFREMQVVLLSCGLNNPPVFTPPL